MSDETKPTLRVIDGEGQKSAAERAREVAQAVIDHYFGEHAITVKPLKPDLRVVREPSPWSARWDELAPK